MSEIDIAGAQEAYNAATQAATPTDQGTSGLERNELGQWVAREQPAPPAEPAVDAQQEAPATPEVGTEEAPSFTNIDPNVLPPEMQQLYRSMQADYTRKTQEVAPWRKLGEEFNVQSPEDFRDALTAYQTLQDPRNWPTVHQELSQYMQQYGMSPQEANLAASNQLAQMAPAEEDQFDAGYVDDESIAPLARQLQQTQAQLAQLRNEWQSQQQRQAEEVQQQAIIQGLIQQQTQLVAQNPHLTPEDIDTIYNFMGSDGNLFAAHQKYEAAIGARLSKYIQGKQTTQTSHPGVVPGAGVHSQQEQRQPKDLNEAYQMALADITAQERAAE